MYFPVKINIKKQSLTYIEISEKELREKPFHDNRLMLNKELVKSRSLDEISDGITGNSVSFIFHTAFCGSTFLSRLLANTECFFALREPSVLMDIANFIRMESISKADESIYSKKSINALNCSESKPRPLLIKPTNAANNLIQPLLTSLPRSKAILLYLDLDDFLISILKKGELGKSFIRNLYNVLSLDKSPYAMTDFRKVNTLTDLQIACLVWAMQMHQYYLVEQDIADKFTDRVKFLNANEFLNNPQQALIPIAQFFGIDLSTTQIRELQHKGAFSGHAKLKNKVYNSEIRQQEQQEIKHKYQQEFEQIHQWIKRFLDSPPMPEQINHLNLF